MMCDRDTCGDVNCFDTGSLGSIAIQSSDDFIVNLLHLKCKVIQLARRQMQKEIPGLQSLGMRQGYLTISADGQRFKTSTMGQGIAEDSVISTCVRHKAKISGKDKGEAVSIKESSKVETSAASTMTRPIAVLHTGTETTSNSLVDWIKRILTNNLSFYWIILVIGVLGFTSLVCGVLLGAFICTNGSRSFPFFFWSKSRVGRAVY